MALARRILKAKSRLTTAYAGWLRKLLDLTDLKNDRAGLDSNQHEFP